MEQATGVFPLCTLIKSNGSRCTSAALPGMNFCFQHIGGSLSALTCANKSQRPPAKLQLAYPGDRPSLQYNLHLIAQALSDGKIDAAEANAYNRLYRTAELNLRHWHSEQQQPSPLVLPTEMGAEMGAEMGTPFKRSLSGEQQISDNVILSGATAEIEVEEPVLNIVVEPAFRDAGSTTSLGAPSFAKRRVGEQHPPFVIPTEAREAGAPADRSSSVGWEASVAERPALGDAGSTTSPDGGEHLQCVLKGHGFSRAVTTVINRGL